MGVNDAEIRFRASLEDDVSPKAEKLERKLRQMGATPAEVKMFIRAQDDASRQIRELQKHVDRLEKTKPQVRVMGDTSHATREMKKFRAEAEQPVKLSFMSNLDEQLGKMFQLRSMVGGSETVPGIPGLRALGAGAAGVGVAGAAVGLVQQGVQVNSEREQSMVTLTQTLKDNTQAQQEMGKIVDIAQKTPFQYKDVLQGDVRLRSYGIPSMAGEGGPGNKGYLKTAGDMAAAMNTPITQAVEAIADARQGYFVRMMSYGIRMMREDFQAGGKYAGQTYEQGLEKAVRRFEGAQEMQSKTFQGITSNLKDIFQNQVVMPIGAPVFEQARSSAQGLMEKTQDPEFQKDLGKQLQRVQETMVDVFQKMKEGKQYFEDNIKQPLIDIGMAAVGVGNTLVRSFLGPLISVAKTAGETILGIAKPLSSLAGSGVGQKFIQIYGTFKALSMLGFKGPLEGLQKMMSLNPINWVRGISELGSSATKAGMLLIVKGFLDANNASNRLETSVKRLGAGSHFKAINADISKMANGLGQSATNMKRLVSEAINMQTSNFEDAFDFDPDKASAADKQNILDLSKKQATDAALLDKDKGINASDASRMIGDEMRRIMKENPGSRNNLGAVEAQAAQSVRDLKTASDALKISFQDAQRVIAQFGGAGAKVGLSGPAAGGYIAALSQGAKGLDLTKSQVAGGITTSSVLVQRMLGQYASPSAESMRQIGPGGLSRFYDFKSPNDPTNPFSRAAGTQAVRDFGMNPRLKGPMQPSNDSGTDLQQTQSKYRSAMQQLADMSDTSAKQLRNAQKNQSTLDKVAAGTGVKLPNMIYRGGIETQKFDRGLFDTKDPAKQAEILRVQIDKTNKSIEGNQKTIEHVNNAINFYNNRINTLTQGSAAVGLAMQKMQAGFVPVQRAIEDLSLASAKYSFDNLRPLERQMTRLGQASAEVGNKMMNAQYSMSKFNTGLLTGEQAANDQMHAMERYNRQLQIMQLSYTQIGAELGQTTYSEGAKLRVNPLAGISLSAQMARTQRKQQLQQLKNEQQFDRYDLEKAARPKNERTEMSLEDRIKGTKKAVDQIDEGTRAQHRMSNQQFDLQSKMFKVNEYLADQQDKITGLSLQLQSLQQSGKMRKLEDAQRNIGLATADANIALTTQNTKLAQIQANIDPLKDKKKIFTDLRDGLLEFKKASDVVATRRVIDFAESTKLITPKQADKLRKEVAEVDLKIKRDRDKNPDWRNNKKDWEEIFMRGTKGLFTGETFRTFGDQIKAAGDKIGGPAKPISDVVGSGVVAGALTALTVGSGFLVLTGLATNLTRQVLIRGGMDTFARLIPGPLRDIAGGRIGGGFRNLVGQQTFRRALTDPFRLVRRGRVAAGTVLGAGLGGAVGGPPGGALGGLAGGRLAERYTLRELRAILGGGEGSKAARAASKARAQDEKVAGQNEKAARDQKSAARRAEAAAKKSAGAADDAGKVASRFARIAEKFPRGARFAAGATAFVAAVANFGGILDALKGWMSKLPGFRSEPKVTLKGPTPDNRDRTRSAGDLKESQAARAAKQAREELGDNPSKGKIASWLSDHPRSAKALKAAGVVGDAAFVASMASSAAGGNDADRNVLAATAAATARQARKAAIEGLEKGYTGKALRNFIIKRAGKKAIPILGALSIGADLFELMERNVDLDGFEKQQAEAKKLAPDLREAYLRGRAMDPNVPEHLRGAAKSSLNTTRINRLKAEKERLLGQMVNGDTTIVDDMNQPASEGDTSDKRIKEIDAQLRKLRDKDKDHEEKRKDIKSKGEDDIKKVQDAAGNAMSQLTDDQNLDLRRRMADHQRKLLASNKSAGNELTTDVGDYLSKIGKKTKDFAKAFGLDVGPTRGSYSARVDAGEVAGPAVPERRAGGYGNDLPTIKGVGDGKGRLYRAGEEGDEVIIPLVPHRRQRAISLAKQTLGRLGATDAHPGFANGGDPAYGVAKAVYEKASSAIGFANGGYVQGASAAGLTGPTQAFAQRMFKLGYSVTSAKRNGSGTSQHNVGQALDFGNSVNDLGKLWSLLFPIRAQFNQLLGPPGLYNGLKKFTDAALQADHNDHIHVGMAGAIEGSLKNLANGMGGGSSSTGGTQRMTLPKVKSSVNDKGGVGKLIFALLDRKRRQLENKVNRAAGNLGSSSTDDLPTTGGGNSSENQKLGKRMAAMRGWKGGEWTALQKLWTGESGWNHHADNPSSDAYGIPQSLPGSKMASAGSDWHDNPATQIKWGLGYIKDRYGSPSKALSAWMGRSPHWYAAGGPVPGHGNSDTVPAMLTPGEHVLTKKEVQNAGGHHVIKQIRKMLGGGKQGGPSHFASGGAVDRVLNKYAGDVPSDTSAKLMKHIEAVVDNLEKMRKRLGSIDEKTMKPEDKKDLAKMNEDLRKSFGRIADPNASNKRLSKQILNSGDKSGGEDTAALVASEKAKMAALKVDAAAPDRSLVTEMKNLGGIAKALLANAVTPKAKKLATTAVRKVAEASKSAKAVIGVSAKARRQAVTVVGMAKRGVNDKLVKAVTGQGLTKKQSTAYKNVQKARLAVNKAKQTPTKKDDKKAKDLYSSAIKSLQGAVKNGLGTTAKHLAALRKEASKDAAAARKAVSAAMKAQPQLVKQMSTVSKTLSKSGASTLKALQSGTKVSGTALNKLRTEVSKQAKSNNASTAKAAKAVQSIIGKTSASAKAHLSSQNAAKAKAASLRAVDSREHLKDISVKTKLGAEGTHKRVADSVKEAKEQNKSLHKADTKKDKADMAQDKRERDYFAKSIALLQHLAEKDTNINVHNEAKGATLHTTIVQTKRRSR